MRNLLNNVVLFVLTVCFFVPFFSLLFISVMHSFLGVADEKE